MSLKMQNLEEKRRAMEENGEKDGHWENGRFISGFALHITTERGLRENMFSVREN